MGPIAGVNAVEKSWFLGLRAHGCVVTPMSYPQFMVDTDVNLSPENNRWRLPQPNEKQVVLDASRQLSITCPNASNAEYSCTSVTSHKNARLKTWQSSNFF